MRRLLIPILLASCVPSQRSVLGPIDVQIQARLGIDPRVPAAVSTLLAKPLDLDGAVRIALANNRRLQAALDDVGVAAAAIADATVLAPTEVDFDYKTALSGSGSETELTAVQDILGLLQIGQRRGAAKAGLEAAQARATQATVELAAQVSVAFYELVAAQQQAELRETAHDAADAAAEITKRMHDAGNTTDLALAREQSQEEESELDLTQAETDVKTRRADLAALLGVDGDAQWSVIARLPDVPASAPVLDDLDKVAVDRSLAIAALGDDARAAAGEASTASVRRWLPELGIGVAVSRREGGDWEAGPALRIGLPIFGNGGGAVARARAEQHHAEDLAAAETTEIGAKARAVREQATAAYADARRLHDKVLPLRQQVLDETLKQYNAMNASTFELLAARRDVVDAGSRYIDALRRYWIATARADALRRGALPEMP